MRNDAKIKNPKSIRAPHTQAYPNVVAAKNRIWDAQWDPGDSLRDSDWLSHIWITALGQGTSSGDCKAPITPWGNDKWLYRD